TSNSKVATVSNGVVKAVAAGNATITVTTEDGSHTATCELTVTEKPSSGGDNTLLYVGIAAAIILVILAAFLLMRRRS
ncbi:MAG: Ig-like domain-containing protein, partial [Candidatus Methanomethylophilaceae archaeon]|nr:Ig-like domain-containing protein [Candidatus Methanomethylophilaceae archaeon]